MSKLKRIICFFIILSFAFIPLFKGNAYSAKTVSEVSNSTFARPYSGTDDTYDSGYDSGSSYDTSTSDTDTSDTTTDTSTDSDSSTSEDSDDGFNTGGAAAGAAIGAAIGSAIPGVGTAAGAVVGGIIGGFGEPGDGVDIDNETDTSGSNNGGGGHTPTCSSEDSKGCYDDSVYWYDSCDNRGDLIEDCTDYGDRAFCGGAECQSTPEAYDLENSSPEPEEYCEVENPPVDLYWKYRSQTDDDQNAYRLQISTQDDYSYVLRDTGKTSCSHPCGNSYQTSDLSFDTTYYWRVKVWDENSNESEWFNASFTTGPERADVDFSWNPENPYSEEMVKFTDQTEEGDVELIDWSWTFENGDPSSSFHINPRVEFTEGGDHEINLEVTDQTGVTCSENKTITVNYELPEWKETSVK